MKRIGIWVYSLILCALVCLLYGLFREKAIFYKGTFDYIKESSSRVDYTSGSFRADEVSVIMFGDTVRKMDVVNIVEALLDGGAAVVGMDFFFEKDVPNEADSLILAVARTDERLVLPYKFEMETLTPVYCNGIRGFSDVPSMGYANFRMVDGVTRLLNKEMEIDGERRKSFATVICEKYLGHACDDPRQLIDFRYTCHMVDYRPDMDFTRFKGQIVIVGSKTIKDYKITPGRLMFGAELQGVAAATILSNEETPISKTKKFLLPFVIVAVCVLIHVLTGFRWWGNPRRFRLYRMMEAPLLWAFSAVVPIVVVLVFPSFDDYWWSLLSIPVMTSFLYTLTKNPFIYIYIKLRHGSKAK